MLTGIHFLLTYTCNYECDHCFLYSGPQAQGVFTLAQIRQVLAEARKIGTVESIYFEGGEPFLYYPLMVEGLKLARGMGFTTGVVTNCYWATAEEDARLWLGSIAETGIDDLSFSNDSFHHGDALESPAERAARAATALGKDAFTICIEAPTMERPTDARGEPVVGGGALFKGRAAEKLVGGLPTRPAEAFRECTHEELVEPNRVHVDPFGHVHICQGISIGNMWERPLSDIATAYDQANHPICGPLVQGGPAALAATYGMGEDGAFVDECHCCYEIRRELLARFPEHLAPGQVYGLDAGNEK